MDQQKILFVDDEEQIRRLLSSFLTRRGYLVQTAADLGIVGLVLSLTLLGAWIAATIGGAGVWRPRPPGLADGERHGLIALAVLVVVFGVHSLVDWTWFIPGTALPALLCAGWTAGRGPGTPRAAGDRAMSPLRIAAAVVVVLAALAGAISATRPEQSATKIDDALAALAAAKPDRALALASDAVRANPLAVEPLFTQSRIQTTQGRRAEALAPLQRAVQLQPANPEPWIHLAQFDLAVLRDAGAAKRDIAPALYLDPRSRLAQAVFLEADRRAGG